MNQLYVHYIVIMLQIVVDVREHGLIEKLRGIATESKSDISIVTEQLLLGDILLRKKIESVDSEPKFKEIILYERKSFTDLLASIKDGRYEEQSHRLIHSGGMNPHNICYLLEGTFATLRNPADKCIILSAMTSLSYFKGFSVFRTATIYETAELIWAMANKIQKEFEKGREVPSYCSRSFVSASQPNNTTEEQTSNSTEEIGGPVAYSNFVKKSKRENITPENIGEILLCQIPGISSHIATEVLKHFGGSFTQLITEIKTSPEKLDAIYLESSKGDGKRRKLSSAVVQSILRFL
jgi:ERCC4-type nuclease